MIIVNKIIASIFIFISSGIYLFNFNLLLWTSSWLFFVIIINIIKPYLQTNYIKTK